MHPGPLFTGSLAAPPAAYVSGDGSQEPFFASPAGLDSADLNM